MIADLSAWAARLEASPLGAWMRSDALAYPVVNVIHLFGLILLIGPILLLDLRLLGAARHFPLVATSDLLTRWSKAGLLLLLGSGAFMFAADARPLIENPIMQVKLLAIALGITNAIAFRVMWHRQLSSWDERPPWIGRVQAAGSILIWPVAAVLGRWIAYS